MTINEKVSGVDKEELISRKIKIDVSIDGYEAYLTVDDPDIQMPDIQAAFEANGIAYGIDLKASREAISNPGQRVLIASGSRHTDGADAFFEQAEVRMESEAEKKFGIRNVYAGDLVGVIHKPTTGSVGIDVYGRKVQPKQGRAANMFTGPNIKRIETGEEIRLEAAVDGNLRVGNASIEILEEHIIHEDIDYSDGELEFAGSLRITGDVKGSGSLKVKHDLFVQGSVEDAKIIAEGNVTVTGSFVGRGDGLIRARGDVAVNVVLNQMVEAGESIMIGKESVNAHLIASDGVLATKGVIMGGTVAAGERIEVHTLGGELYSTTRVKLGLKELLNEDMSAIDKEIELQTKSIDQLKNEVYVLVRDRIDGNNFTGEKADQLKILQGKLQRQNEYVKELIARKQETVVEMSRKRSPKLTVLGTIHPSVAAEINGVRLSLKQSYNNVTFEELRNEIIRTKNL
jgi:uncharacterized protein (DUF342 family)